MGTVCSYISIATCIKGKIPKKAHNMVEKVRTVTSSASSYDDSPSTIISAKHCMHGLLLISLA